MTSPQPHGHTPAWPHQRRLRALLANGMNQRQLEAAGLTPDNIANICDNNTHTINITTAQQIDTLWDKHKNDPHQEPTPLVKAHHWPTPWEWDDIDNPDENPQVRRIAETNSPRELVNALDHHYGMVLTAAHAVGIPPSTLSYIRSRDRANHKTMRTLREHWCQLHNLPIPQVDDVPIPPDLSTAMTRWAAEAGARWLPHMESVDKGTIPTRSSAAATLGITEGMVEKIMRGKGKISLSDLDRLCIKLGIITQAAA